jgi:hypothetical protein
MDNQWVEGKPQVPGIYWMRQEKGIVLCFVAESLHVPPSLVAARLVPGRSRFSVYNSPSLEDFECLEFQDVGMAIGLEYQKSTMIWSEDG